MKNKDSVTEKSAIVKSIGGFVIGDNSEPNILLSVLQQNDSPYVQLLNLLSAAIYTCNAKGEITFHNEAAAELWGRRPVMGKDLWCGSSQIYDTYGHELPRENYPMAITVREGKVVGEQEIVIERPDSKKLNVMAYPRPIFDTTGKIAGAINLLVDVTELRRTGNAPAEGKHFRTLADQPAGASLEAQVAERTRELTKKIEKLRQSEDRYHRMIADVQDYAIILLDQNGIIENWNKGAEKIKGYSASEILGKNFKVFYTSEDQESGLPEQLIEEARKNGTSSHEGWRVRKDGSRFWGSVVITCLHDATNTPIGFSKVTRDLTEKRDAELQLREKNQELETMNQELSSFAYVSSHDLQEPLRKIQTFAARIAEIEGDNLSEKGKDYFSRMQNAAQRMQTLIEDLLCYSRTNTAEKKFESTDLNRLLKDVQNELAETIEEKKAVISASPLPLLNVIAFQTKQLFSNVLSNALKFSKADTPPRIHITAEIVKGKNIQKAQAIPNQSYHHIAVRDNGIGFEPEHSQKIFDVFHRLHGRSEFSGTGIGLAICKKIMDNHHGMITAESELDQGATFHIYFPA